MAPLSDLLTKVEMEENDPASELKEGVYTTHTFTELRGGVFITHAEWRGLVCTT